MRKSIILGSIIILLFLCGGCQLNKENGTEKGALHVIHNYMEETLEATCTDYGSRKTYCSTCGYILEDVRTESAYGHFIEEVWFGEEPSCTNGGYRNLVCARCGFLDTTASGSVAPLAHQVTDAVLQTGDCSTFTVIRHSCIRCGEQIGVDTCYKEDDKHNWITDEYGTYCSRCLKAK